MKRTKIFSVRSSPDPPIFKKIVVPSSPDPSKIGFSADPVLIRAHLWCQAKFLTSRRVRIHRLTFYTSTTLRKLMIKA